MSMLHVVGWSIVTKDNPGDFIMHVIEDGGRGTQQRVPDVVYKSSIVFEVYGAASRK